MSCIPPLYGAIGRFQLQSCTLCMSAPTATFHYPATDVSRTLLRELAPTDISLLFPAPLAECGWAWVCNSFYSIHNGWSPWAAEHGCRYRLITSATTRGAETYASSQSSWHAAGRNACCSVGYGESRPLQHSPAQLTACICWQRDHFERTSRVSLLLSLHLRT